MDPELETRRRVLLLAHARYIAAEHAWTKAQREVQSWFPKTQRPTVVTIGNPGSMIRRLHDQRERTILQLEVARIKLEVAKRRLERKH